MVGMKSYGRAPTFLLRTGYEQVRSVVAALAGDWESARRVELVLPETGVCNRPAGAGRDRRGRASACCGSGSPHAGADHGGVIADASPAQARAPAWRTRAWGIVGALSVTETVSWGILYYAFAVFLLPMQQELGYSAAQLTGAFSLALLVSAVAGIAVGRHLDRHSPRDGDDGRLGGRRAARARLVAGGRAARPSTLLWIGIGVVMAAVLYEPAFTVLAKWFPEPAERRRAMTAMTLAGRSPASSSCRSPRR